MASVLVDSEEISYMDEITDSENEQDVDDPNQIVTRNKSTESKAKKKTKSKAGDKNLQNGANKEIFQGHITNRDEKKQKFNFHNKAWRKQTQKDLEKLDAVILKRELFDALDELTAESKPPRQTRSDKEEQVTTGTKTSQLSARDKTQRQTNNGPTDTITEKYEGQYAKSLTFPKSNESGHQEIDNQDIMNDKSKLLDQKTTDSGINENKQDAFNGAKPKRLLPKTSKTKRKSYKDLNEATYLPDDKGEKDTDKDVPVGRQSRKAKKSVKNKQKMYLELPKKEMSVSSPESDIKILVTDEDGLEVPTTSPSIFTFQSNGTCQNIWRSSSIKSNSSYHSLSSDDESPTQHVTTPMNFLRALDQDEANKTENSLLRKKELYNMQKAKPFQKFAKIKLGVYPVAVEGDSRSCNIKAITVMPNKRLVLFDKRNKCIKLFDTDFSPLDRVNMGTKYCNLTAMSGNTFAITLPQTRQLQIYHIDNSSNKLHYHRTHPAEGEFYSISYHHKKLYVLQKYGSESFVTPDEWQIKKIRAYKFDANMATLRTFSPGHKDCSLCANENGLYFTNRTENEVLMLKHDGTLLYRHKVEFCLPMGINCDRYGNVFVCGGSVTSYIELIKPDLRKYRIIYNKTSSNPVALCIDKEENVLYVSDQILGKVIKYRIEHNGTVHGLMQSLFMGKGRNP